MYRTLAILSTVIALMLVYTAPLSAESTTAPETSAITQDDLKAAYQAGKADTITQRLSSGDTAYENAYMDGAVDALQSPEDTITTLYTICGERGGQLAEDYSCIENPKQYYSN